MTDFLFFSRRGYILTLFSSVYLCSQENNTQSVWPPSHTRRLLAEMVLTDVIFRQHICRCCLFGEEKKSLLSTAFESAVSRDSHFPGTLYANGKVPWRCIMLCGLINSMRKTVGPGRERISSLSLASQLHPHNKEHNKEPAEQWVDLCQGFLLHHWGSQLKQLNQPTWQKTYPFSGMGVILPCTLGSFFVLIHAVARRHPWCQRLHLTAAFCWCCRRVSLSEEKRGWRRSSSPASHHWETLAHLCCKQQLGGIQQSKHWQQIFQSSPFSSGRVLCVFFICVFLSRRPECSRSSVDHR